MPPVGHYKSFKAQMLETERKFLRSSSVHLEEARKELVTGITFMGIDDLNTIPFIERTLEQLQPNIASLGSEAASGVLSNSEAFSDKQLGTLRRFIPEVPDVAALKDPVTEREALDPLQNGLSEWFTITKGQFLADVNRLRLTGEEDAAIIIQLFDTGTKGENASLWRKALNNFDSLSQLQLWGASASILTGWYKNGKNRGFDFKHQVVAAIDERTTQTCLRAHGQIQDLDKPFKLSGKPKFSNRMLRTPFHWYCRTAIILYMPQLEDVGPNTDEMVKAARSELRARALTRRRVVIHPAHATSKRRR